MMLLPSCASLFNEKSQCIHIYTDSTVKLTKVDSSVLLYHEPNDEEYYVRRGKDPLKLSLVTSDSLAHNFYLQKKLSPAFLLANCFTPLGVGYVVDLFHEKRYMYPPRNYFSYDRASHQLNHDIFKPMKSGNIQFSIGWDFMNLYHQSLFVNQPPDFSFLGLHIGSEYFLAPKRSLQLEVGYNPRVTTALLKRRYFLNAPLDSVIKTRTTNFWVSANYKLRARRCVYGAGLVVAGLRLYEKKEYYITYDSIQAVPLDTFSITRKAYSRSTMWPLIKMGLNFKMECKLGNSLTLGGNWQLYCADINRPKLYASHFFNFYVSLNVYETSLKKNRKLKT